MNLLLTFIAIGLTLPAAYLGLLLLGACLRRTRQSGGEGKQVITVVIPSHNEEAGITQTIRALHQSQYPKDKYNIIILADNCTDQTASVAAKEDVTVIERIIPDIRGKGQALDWLFKNHSWLFSQTDIISIVDADTQVDPKFLEELNFAFSSETVQVVQGFYGVSNPGVNWRTGLSTAALAVAHHLRPLGRNQWGGTAGLKGNGMGFRTSLLLTSGWPALSVVEDLEFTLILLEQGHRVQYAPKAKVYGEMAVSSEQAAIQRQRWEGGRLQIVRQFLGRIWGKGSKAGWPARFDLLLDLITPPLTQYVALLVFGLIGLFFLSPYAWIFPLLGLLLAGLVLATSLVMTKASPKVWMSILMTPFFLLWKLPLIVNRLFGKGVQSWRRTPRVNETIKNEKSL